MYESAEAYPEPSQASKINTFARIVVSVIKLTLLFLPKVTWVSERPLTGSNAGN